MQATPAPSAMITPAVLGGDGTSASRQSGSSAATAVQSEDLLQGKKAVEISHNGAIYRLQATKLGKLILTK